MTAGTFVTSVAFSFCILTRSHVSLPLSQSLSHYLSHCLYLFSVCSQIIATFFHVLLFPVKASFKQLPVSAFSILSHFVPFFFFLSHSRSKSHTSKCTQMCARSLSLSHTHTHTKTPPQTHTHKHTHTHTTHTQRHRPKRTLQYTIFQLPLSLHLSLFWAPQHFQKACQLSFSLNMIAITFSFCCICMKRNFLTGLFQFCFLFYSLLLFSSYQQILLSTSSHPLSFSVSLSPSISLSLIFLSQSLLRLKLIPSKPVSGCHHGLKKHQKLKKKTPNAKPHQFF